MSRNVDVSLLVCAGALAILVYAGAPLYEAPVEARRFACCNYGAECPGAQLCCPAVLCHILTNGEQRGMCATGDPDCPGVLPNE